MSPIIYSAISGQPVNNRLSISVSVGNKNSTYHREYNGSIANINNIDLKYSNKFINNDIEYNLWLSDPLVYVPLSPTPTQSLTPTPTITPVTPTPTTSPITPTPTVTNTITPSITTSLTQTPTSSLVSPTPSVTNTITPSVTTSITPTVTATSTLTPSITPTITPSKAIVLVSNTANYNNCGGNVSTVGTNGKPSYYGAYDFAGNVWEWTEGLVGSDSRVFRGGNLAYDAAYLSSSYRNYTSASSYSEYIGMRVAAIQSSNIYTNLLPVGDINNSSDTTGYGSVSYLYYIGTYEVTNQEYIEFLNAVAKTDTHGLYVNNMYFSPYGGINRSGSVGNYTYSAKTNMANKPVNLVTWNSCARYCNWLHNGKPSGLQDASTTETGAYNMSQNNPSRSNNALFFLCSENEWYKAAFYKGNGTNSGYWLFATQSNIAPSCVSLDSQGNGITT